jgi:outer membrane lipoprotein
MADDFFEREGLAGARPQKGRAIVPPSASLRLVLAGLWLLGVAGCVTYPMTKPLREQAKATKDVAFATIQQNPKAYEGRTVIWGGEILEAVNGSNGGAIYVLQAPLDTEGRPASTKMSQGRFVGRSPGFLDPEVYRKGEIITIGGDLSGTETRNIGNANYACPVIMLREVYFWRPGPAVYMSPSPWGWYGPYGPYYGGFYGPYYYGGSYYPGHRYWHPR